MVAIPMTDDERKMFAEDCVSQGVQFRIEPHYLLGVGQLRSGLSNGDDGTRIGVYRLAQAEWDANRENQEFDIHFTAAHITDPTRQSVVYAFMASKAFDAFVAAKNRNPSAKELYLQQWPNGATATFDTDFQKALDDTAALIDPAAKAVLDDPETIAPIPKPDSPTTGPLKKLDPEVVPPQPDTPGLLTLDMLRRRWPNAPAPL